jgi:CDP-diacylglycerol--glycerol-3-phosphate 3-phosphatidyltransferase
MLIIRKEMKKKTRKEIKKVEKEINKVEKKIKENIYNAPNFLTLLRVLIALVIIYLIFANYSLPIIMILFIIGSITDTLDGNIARRFQLKTEFGRKFDMIADRVLLLGTLLAFIIKFSIEDILTSYHVLQLILISARELICLPFLLVILYRKKNPVPHTNWIGKTTTVMQSISFPLLILYILYPQTFYFSIYFAVVTAIFGILTARRFILYAIK